MLLHVGSKGQMYKHRTCKNDLESCLKEMLSGTVVNKLSIN